MHPNTSLGLEKESKLVEHIKYRQMIGSLLYPTTSRPDIIFTVCLCARVQSSPKRSTFQHCEKNI